MGLALVWEKSSDYKIGTVDQDGLWKKVIGELFEEFILFFSPELHAAIDFSVEQEFLQQELFKQIMDDKKGSRSADQIVKVRLKDGHEKWILIHIEVQSTNEKEFSERMFQYFYRIYDAYAQEIVAMAVMTSPYRSKYHDKFHYDFFGTQLTYAYNNYKLIDYDEATLKASNQIFSKIILAAKYRYATKDDAEKRYTFKEQLLKELVINEQFSDIKIQAAFYFIDYLLRLPIDLTTQLNHSLIPFMQKEENKMVKFFDRELSPTLEAFVNHMRDGLKEEVIEEVTEEVTEQITERVTEKAKEEAIENVAIEMLKTDIPLEYIKKVTKLSSEQIKALKESL